MTERWLRTECGGQPVADDALAVMAGQEERQATLASIADNE